MRTWGPVAPVSPGGPAGPISPEPWFPCKPIGPAAKPHCPGRSCISLLLQDHWTCFTRCTWRTSRSGFTMDSGGPSGPCFPGTDAPILSEDKLLQPKAFSPETHLLF
ncbi:MAG: hypothetical protein P0116_12365 [Candidatus Nitrosocosmicus sp.]|nr:hypothetical protein [Candidatus Nitrosocosmicus sp.]